MLSVTLGIGKLGNGSTIFEEMCLSLPFCYLIFFQFSTTFFMQKVSGNHLRLHLPKLLPPSKIIREGPIVYFLVEKHKYLKFFVETTLLVSYVFFAYNIFGTSGGLIFIFDWKYIIETTRYILCKRFPSTFQ